MSAKPMTRQAWLDYLKKAVDEFDWDAAGQEREWVGLTEEDFVCVNQLCETPIQGAEYAQQLLKEKNHD